MDRLSDWSGALRDRKVQTVAEPANRIAGFPRHASTK